MKKDNSEISFSDAPIEFQLKHYEKNEKALMWEVSKLKEKNKQLEQDIRKILEFHRTEKELLASKFATPISVKESKTRTIRFLKEAKLWARYSMWLLKDRGYISEKIAEKIIEKRLG